MGSIEYFLLLKAEDKETNYFSNVMPDVHSSWKRMGTWNQLTTMVLEPLDVTVKNKFKI